LSVTNEGDAKSEPSSIFGPQPKPVTSHKKKKTKKNRRTNKQPIVKNISMEKPSGNLSS